MICILFLCYIFRVTAFVSFFLNIFSADHFVIRNEFFIIHESNKPFSCSIAMIFRARQVQIRKIYALKSEDQTHPYLILIQNLKKSISAYQDHLIICFERITLNSSLTRTDFGFVFTLCRIRAMRYNMNGCGAKFMNKLDC